MQIPTYLSHRRLVPWGCGPGTVGIPDEQRSGPTTTTMAKSLYSNPHHIHGSEDPGRPSIASPFPDEESSNISGSPASSLKLFRPGRSQWLLLASQAWSSLSILPMSDYNLVLIAVFPFLVSIPRRRFGDCDPSWMDWKDPTSCYLSDPSLPFCLLMILCCFSDACDASHWAKLQALPCLPIPVSRAIGSSCVQCLSQYVYLHLSPTGYTSPIATHFII